MKCEGCNKNFCSDTIQAHLLACFKLHKFNGSCFEIKTSGIQEVARLPEKFYVESFLEKVCSPHGIVNSCTELTTAITSIVKGLFEDISTTRVAVESLIQNTPQNGVLEWKVDHFSSRRDAAFNLECPSVFSQHFFTAQNGYKMRVCLFPNGFNDGTNSYLSLLIVIVKGNYDHLLAWPVRMNITFKLLNTKNGEFFFVPFETTFNRPMPANEAGYFKFIPLDHVMREYVLDDIIFIICEVVVLPR